MKESLLSSFDKNKWDFIKYYKLATRQDVQTRTEYIIYVAEIFGKCKMIANILYKDFGTDKKDELDTMNQLITALY